MGIENDGVGDVTSAFYDWTVQIGDTDVRRRLELWWMCYPRKAQKHLFARLQGEPANYQGAIFELLMCALLTGFGCEVDVLDVDGLGANPDFLVKHKNRECFIEATVVMPKSAPSQIDRNRDDALDKLNQLSSSKFELRIKIEGYLDRTLSVTEVIQPFERLLNTHDHLAVKRVIDYGGIYAAPSEEIAHGNWRLRGWLKPLRSENGKEAPPRQIAAGFGGSNKEDVSNRVKDAVLVKANKYEDSHTPLIVAVNPLNIFFNSENDDLEALFGKEQVRYIKEHPEVNSPMNRKQNGIWVGRAESNRPAHPAAVMICRRISPYSLNAPVNLYLNPFISEPELPESLYQVPHLRGKDERMIPSGGGSLVSFLDPTTHPLTPGTNKAKG